MKCVVSITGRGQNTWVSPEGCLMFSTSTHLNIQGELRSFSAACIVAFRGLSCTMRRSEHA